MENIFGYISNNLDLIISTFMTLSISVIVGGLIGLERTISGSPAGFRTHILVCLASTLLTLLSVYQIQLMPHLPLEVIRSDPTRMAQGIMTGIGFLGAGVIMKTGLTVRGLTTAATLWITSAIGILIGVQFHIGAFLGALTILSTLIIFRWLEKIIPTHNFGKLKIVVENMTPEIERNILDMLEEFKIAALKTSYGFEKGCYEYRMTIKTPNLKQNASLAYKLSKTDFVKSFDIQSIRT